MTLQEAIKSGKRFKRPKYSLWLEPDETHPDGHTIFNLKEEDILSDDWEIEEETVTITREQLMKALSSNVFLPYPYCLSGVDSYYKEISKQLGFKD